MDQTLGFIGAGNMVSAILTGVLEQGLAQPEDIWLSNRSPEKLEPWRAKGVHVTLDNAEVAQRSQMVVLGVKPQVFDAVIPQIAPYVAGKCIVSIAAGISSAYLKARLPWRSGGADHPQHPHEAGQGRHCGGPGPRRAGGKLPHGLFAF